LDHEKYLHALGLYLFDAMVLRHRHSLLNEFSEHEYLHEHQLHMQLLLGVLKLH
jgi:hypothetical protein